MHFFFRFLLVCELWTKNAEYNFHVEDKKRLDIELKYNITNVIKILLRDCRFAFRRR